jgi:transcriptional regulator with XRE-family HTH domain
MLKSEDLKRRDQNIRIAFGANLQRIMAEKGWTQTEFARRANLHLTPTKQIQKAAMNRYVHGKVLPNGIFLGAIAKAAGLEPEDLLPTGRHTNMLESSEEFTVSDQGEGEAWLSIRKSVSWQVAAQVIDIIRKADLDAQDK